MQHLQAKYCPWFCDQVSRPGGSRPGGRGVADLNVI